MTKIEQDLGLWRSSMAAGRMAYEAGNFTVAVKEYKLAIKIAENNDLQGPLLSEPIIYLSICLSARKEYNEAESLLRRALSLNQPDADESKVLLALNYHELSILLWRTGRAAESQQNSELAFNMLHQAKSYPTELEVMILKQQAVLFTDTRSFKEAEQLLERATHIVLASSSLGKDSLVYGQVLITKALLNIDQQDFEKARELYEQGIGIVEMHWGPHHPKVAELYEIFARHSDHAGKEDVGAFFHKQANNVRDWLKRGYRW